VSRTPEERLAKLIAETDGGPLMLAESCTGGMISQRITALPGSSEYFDRGLIVYSNRAKTELLGVDVALLEREGAVSRGCAEALLDGLFSRHGAELGAAVTGIAGPDGGTAEKPVGTVWISWGTRQNRQSELLQLAGDRGEVRRQAATIVLERLCEALAQ
jgi:nicotinamide-nucleotide amidase